MIHQSLNDNIVYLKLRENSIQRVLNKFLEVKCYSSGSYGLIFSIIERFPVADEIFKGFINKIYVQISDFNTIKNRFVISDSIVKEFLK